MSDTPTVNLNAPVHLRAYVSAASRILARQPGAEGQDLVRRVYGREVLAFAAPECRRCRGPMISFLDRPIATCASCGQPEKEGK